MKHKLGYLLTAGLAMVLTTVGVVSTKALEKPVEPTFATYTNGDGATYYNGIGDSLTGNSLRSALNSLNDNKRHSTVGYSSMGTSPSGQFKYTDYTTDNIQYDSNGQPYGTKIVSFYSGNSTTAFNREHVWPNSHGGNLTEDDIHMPRPTIEAENGSRGNSFYVEGMKSGTNGWDPAMESFGDETYRGDSARIIFYCMIAEPNYSLLEADYHSTSNNNRDNMMGRLSHLIKWNINYPVTDRERRRNEGAEYLQGNRNPFIDHPEYACRIWGSTNSATQQLCANATYPDQAHTAGIRTDDGYTIGSTNTTVYTLKVGDSVNFLPFVDGAFNASVSWTLSDYTTVSSAYYGRSTYTNGLTITGLAEGTSTLTLSYSYTDNNQQKTATATCIITVSNSESGGGGGESSGDVENEMSATYTVSSTSSVTKTGTAPSGSTASYSQTYGTTSQITGGKNAILTLSGYAGKVITGITLNMKSNSSSGSGSLSITAGSTTLASLNSTGFNGWYDNNSYGTSYRDVHVTLTNSSYVIGNNEAITIRIDASQNSLYISSYTITYGDPSSGGSEEVTLSSITVSGMTQNYIVGDTFSFDGIVTAHYSDGNSETVLPDSVSSPNMSTVGNKTVTVYYSEGGVDESVSYTIYVAAAQKTLTSIAVSTAPTKTTYTAGDYFDPSGLVITRNYSDGSDDTYAYAGHTSEFSFSPTLTASLTTTNTSVIITYSGKTCSQTITVNSSGGGSSGSYTIRYDDTFSPALPASKDDKHTSATLCVDTTASNLSFMEAGIYKGSSSNYIMFAQNSGFIYNTDSLSTIDSISITYSDSTSTSGKIGVYFGSSVQSTYTTTANRTIAGVSQTDKFENSTDNYGYFQISTSNKNVQITTIEIEYHESSTPVTSFSLTYNKNTTDSVSGMPQNITNIESGGSVTLTGSPTRDGYTFVGWSLTTDGETISSISNITENKNVYAIWQENVSPTPSSGAVNYYKLSSTDSITSGRYVIALYNGTSYYAMTRTINSGNKYPLSSAISVTNDCILSANGSEYEFEIEVSQSGITIKNPSTSKYVKYNSSTNLGENENAYYWTQGTAVNGTFRFNSQTSGRLLVGRTGSSNVFGGYASSNITSTSTEYFDIELFRGYSAEDYASEFNSNITCNVQGSSAPSFGAGYSWSKFESNYSDKLTSDQKSIISEATYTKSGSGAQTQVVPGDSVSQNVANCVAKYDYIVGKYNPTLSSTSTWKDFIDRKPAPVTSGRISLDVLGLTSGNATTILVVVSIIGVAALGGYIFIRKRKEI